ncbi:GyrI-like domain-containing protein [Aggregicoccus sp. 17bor-14]|uniref:GyrI-like domain-containing protein n=1 Tax=Myxococcaceae TaxID=31 RepID=UPI00129D05E7|nr:MULTISPECIES: GyrI-like domain-containing protein [Myxococcaceae]MBF5042954.1 GyrI-like domain-containing protein [Simulacricoccus sp. 17bor-14]MRI88720.1 GyrI-like domain-containing protein [Aggregicoccus sp. 17bor-14]
MLEAPQLLTTRPQPAAIIRFTIPRAQMPQIMGPAVQELMAAVKAQGAGPAGPLFAHHLRMSPDTFDFELGLPVTRPVTPVGRVQPGALPATRVARTVYRGPYEGLGGAWGEFRAWIAQQGHTATEGLWECYVSGPEASPDPSQWRTELNQPLVG